MEFKIVPEAQWQPLEKATVCQYADCSNGSPRKFGFFTGAKKAHCKVCGIVCCELCIGSTAVPPRLPDPVAACPRCIQMSKMYLERRASRAQTAASSSSPPSSAASSPAHSPSPKRVTIASSDATAAALSSPPTESEHNLTHHSHMHSHERDPTEDLALSSSGTSARFSASSNAGTPDESALVAALRQQLKDSNESHMKTINRLIEKYEGKISLLKVQHEDVSFAKMATTTTDESGDIVAGNSSKQQQQQQPLVDETIRERLVQAETAASNLQEEREQLVTERDELKSRLAAAEQSSTAQVVACAATAQSEMEALSQQLEGAEVELHETKKQLSETRAALESVQEQHAMQLDEKERVAVQKLDALQAERDDLVKQRDAAVTERDELQSNLDKSASEGQTAVAAAQSERDDLQKQLGALQAERDGAKARELELQTALEEPRAELKLQHQQREKATTDAANNSVDFATASLLDIAEATAGSKRSMLDKIALPMYFDEWRMALLVRRAPAVVSERGNDDE